MTLSEAWKWAREGKWAHKNRVWQNCATLPSLLAISIEGKYIKEWKKKNIQLQRCDASFNNTLNDVLDLMDYWTIELTISYSIVRPQISFQLKQISRSGILRLCPGHSCKECLQEKRTLLRNLTKKGKCATDMLGPCKSQTFWVKWQL